MKTGFYISKLTGRIVWVSVRSQFLSGFHPLIYSTRRGTWIESGALPSFSLEQQPYFKDNSNPTNQELAVLEMVDRDVWSQVMCILDYNRAT